MQKWKEIKVIIGVGVLRFIINVRLQYTFQEYSKAFDVMLVMAELSDYWVDLEIATQNWANKEHILYKLHLDNVFNVIQNNSHKYYADKAEDKTQLFMSILMGREKTPEERADILINGTVRLEQQ